MTSKKPISIVDISKLIKRVNSLKYRDKDTQAKLAHTLKALWNPKRKLATIRKAAQFDSLKSNFPHFEEVIDLISGHAFVSQKFGVPFQIPPILLLGDPGIGKTYFVSELAKLLNLRFYEIGMSTITASFVLSGLSLQWNDAEPGFIANTLADSEIANPIILIDEIDKSSGSGNYSTLGPLYTLLEKHSAKRFKDEALELELNASYINWILTANYSEAIPEPIMSRMMVFNVPLPTREQMKMISQEIFNSLRSANSHAVWFDEKLNTQSLQHLGKFTPRAVRIILEQSMMRALIEDEPELMPKHMKITEERKFRVGFI